MNKARISSLKLSSCKEAKRYNGRIFSLLDLVSVNATLGILLPALQIISPPPLKDITTQPPTTTTQPPTTTLAPLPGIITFQLRQLSNLLQPETSLWKTTRLLRICSYMFLDTVHKKINKYGFYLLGRNTAKNNDLKSL